MKRYLVPVIAALMLCGCEKSKRGPARVVRLAVTTEGMFDGQVKCTPERGAALEAQIACGAVEADMRLDVGRDVTCAQLQDAVRAVDAAGGGTRRMTVAFGMEDVRGDCEYVLPAVETCCMPEREAFTDELGAGLITNERGFREVEFGLEVRGGEWADGAGWWEEADFRELLRERRRMGARATVIVSAAGGERVAVLVPLLQACWHTGVRISLRTEEDERTERHGRTIHYPYARERVLPRIRTTVKPIPFLLPDTSSGLLSAPGGFFPPGGDPTGLVPVVNKIGSKSQPPLRKDPIRLVRMVNEFPGSTLRRDCFTILARRMGSGGRGEWFSGQTSSPSRQAGWGRESRRI